MVVPVRPANAGCQVKYKMCSWGDIPYNNRRRRLLSYDRGLSGVANRMGGADRAMAA